MMIRGSPAICPVMRVAKAFLSTARAFPAGTFVSEATDSASDPSPVISRFSIPWAVSGSVPLNELLHTSSARRSVLWAGVMVPGRISKRSTWTPFLAIRCAASIPARPPPTTRTLSILSCMVGTLGVGTFEAVSFLEEEC